MFDNEDFNGNDTWTFLRTDSEGNVRSSTFKAEDWITAMQEFVYFLKGNGFMLEDGVRLNERYFSENWYGETFATEDSFGL
jgi:hypothetical protein